MFAYSIYVAAFARSIHITKFFVENEIKFAFANISLTYTKRYRHANKASLRRAPLSIQKDVLIISTLLYFDTRSRKKFKYNIFHDKTKYKFSIRFWKNYDIIEKVIVDTFSCSFQEISRKNTYDSQI